MQIEIDWQEPLLIAKHHNIVFSKNAFSKIDECAGVYFFSRKYNNNYEPFYIGETLNLLARLKSHLKNADIREALKGNQDTDATYIAKGEKYFHYGYFKTSSESKAKKCCRIVQKYLIGEALARNIPLLNSQLTKIQTHSLCFSGSKKGRAIYQKKQEVPI